MKMINKIANMFIALGGIFLCVPVVIFTVLLYTGFPVGEYAHYVCVCLSFGMIYILIGGTFLVLGD